MLTHLLRNKIALLISTLLFIILVALATKETYANGPVTQGPITQGPVTQGPPVIITQTQPTPTAIQSGPVSNRNNNDNDNRSSSQSTSSSSSSSSSSASARNDIDINNTNYQAQSQSITVPQAPSQTIVKKVPVVREVREEVRVETFQPRMVVYQPQTVTVPQVVTVAGSVPVKQLPKTGLPLAGLLLGGLVPAGLKLRKAGSKSNDISANYIWEEKQLSY